LGFLLVSCLECYFIFVKPLGTNCENYFSIHFYWEVFNCVRWFMLGGKFKAMGSYSCSKIFFYTYVMDMFWIILVGGDSICVGSYITNGITRR
jgi:hypothetical protein